MQRATRPLTARNGPDLTPDTPEIVAIWQARAVLARTDFSAFLFFVAIEDTKGETSRLPWLPDDSPYQRGAMRFKRWKHLIERAEAWGTGASEVVLKARQLGLTWLAAALAVLIGLQPGGRVLVLSMGEDEAQAFVERCRYIYDRLPSILQRPLDTDNRSLLRFTGGGEIRALPATKKAGRGYTARLVVVDEAAFHPWAADNYSGYRGTVADGGQLLVMSTANGSAGWFHDLWQASQRGTTPFAAVFTDALSRPDRDKAWLAREKSSYAGLPAQFPQEYPMSPEDAFVQLTGLVYPQFDIDRHVRDSDPCEWEDCIYRWASYDLGGGDPTAIVPIGAYRTAGGELRVHQYGEFYRRSGAPTIDEMAAYLWQWHDRAPFTWIEPDHRDAVIGNSLAAMGLPVRPVDMHIWARGEGLGLVGHWLEEGWLTIGADCIESIREFASYRWATRVDTQSKDRYATSTAFDHHGDACDARRGALMGLYYALMGERTNVDAYEGVDL